MSETLYASVTLDQSGTWKVHLKIEWRTQPNGSWNTYFWTYNEFEVTGVGAGP